MNIDAPGILLEQILVRTAHARRNELIKVNGILETVYLGSKGTSESIFRIYEKTVGADGSQQLGVRFEHTDKSGCKLSSLLQYKFPFSNLVVTGIPFPRPEDWNWGDWRLFLTACRSSGVQTALLYLPTARRVAVLSKMFSCAIERGWRTDNPCKGIRKFQEDQRWRNLAEKEVARLLEACDEYATESDGANAADAVRLLLLTGARLREALAAEWSQFDLEAGLWEKPSAHTKQNRQHRLELMGPALDLLRDMRARDPDGRYLFPGKSILGPDGKNFVVKPRADLKRPWAWIVRRAALENVRLHDLRRTTASFMLSGGASLATVGKALGHTQASTTARYAQLAESVQREALGKAGTKMFALKGTTKTASVIKLNAAGTG